MEAESVYLQNNQKTTDIYNNESTIEQQVDDSLNIVKINEKSTSKEKLSKIGRFGLDAIMYVAYPVGGITAMLYVASQTQEVMDTIALEALLTLNVIVAPVLYYFSKQEKEARANKENSSQ